MEGSYAPFDTGSLDGYARPCVEAAPWEDVNKDEFLTAHLGAAADAVRFSVDYVAAHFRSAEDYVSRSQTSTPDFSPYHGLQSMNGDRRTWTIEVCLHDDVPLDTTNVAAIVLGQADLAQDVPDDLLETVVISVDEGAIVSTVERCILQAQA